MPNKNTIVNDGGADGNTRRDAAGHVEQAIKGYVDEGKAGARCGARTRSISAACSAVWRRRAGAVWRQDAEHFGGARHPVHSIVQLKTCGQGRRGTRDKATWSGRGERKVRKKPK